VKFSLNVSDGDIWSSDLVSTIPRRASSSPVRASTQIGTSLSFSSRRCAVTMISSIVVSVAAVAAPSGMDICVRSSANIADAMNTPRREPNIIDISTPPLNRLLVLDLSLQR
jgi:hypothetical protein